MPCSTHAALVAAGLRLYQHRLPEIPVGVPTPVAGFTSCWTFFSTRRLVSPNESAVPELRELLQQLGESHLIMYTSDWRGARSSDRIYHFFIPYEGLLRGFEDATAYLRRLHEEVMGKPHLCQPNV